jgi:transposase
LESSLDADPAEVLRLYKERDKAEKLIRDLKEGAELRPFRCWSENAVKGIVLLVFLTNALLRLTRIYDEFSLAKNVKLLKKYLTNLTLSIVCLKNELKMTFISNFSQELKEFFGNFLQKYARTTLAEWV